MTHDALRLLQGLLGLLQLADLITSPLGLGVILWAWLYLTLPYDSALAIWLVALIPLLLAPNQDTQQ